MDRHKYILLTTMCLVMIALPTSCSGYEQADIIVDKFPICTEGTNHDSLAISGNIVVWVDERDGIYGIRGYDLVKKNEFPICSKLDYLAVGSSTVKISGDIVVWYNYSPTTSFDIWGYDLKTITQFPICTEEGVQLRPRISGDIVLWQNERGDIFVYNLATKDISTIPVSPHDYQHDVDISGDIIVWIGFDGVYGYHIKDRKKFPISIGYNKQDVCISENTVIWLDVSPTSPFWQEGRGGDIIAYDLAAQKEFRLPRTWAYVYSDAYNVAVSEDFVVWSCGGMNSIDVYGYDPITRVKFPICVEDGFQTCVAADSNIVVWKDWRNYKSGIYGARISRRVE